MKKLVNNKVIDVDIELFEKAFESMAINNYSYSNIRDNVPNKDVTGAMGKCINAYNNMYKSLPFPLYAIESDVKYAAMAMYLKDVVKSPIEAWVDGGLYIYIDADVALKFVGSSWSITGVKHKQEDNTNIEDYKDSMGYREFKWALVQLMNKKSLKNYYKMFMPKFVEACNADVMVLKWELARILEIGRVPNPIKFKANTIVNFDRNSELYIDIFSTGKRKDSRGSKYIIRIGSNKDTVEKNAKYTTTYDFELYEKGIDYDNTIVIGKLKKLNLDCALNIFETIVGKGSLRDGVENIAYKGIITNNILVYQVENTLYICRADRYSKSREIANNVELYSCEEGIIYFYKNSLCDNGAIKEVMYGYKLQDSSIRICNIKYRGGNQ